MKLLVTDYDNTYELHYKNLNLEKIFKTNYDAVSNYMMSNNLFVIASGRHFNALKKTIDEKELKFDYLIANNGAELYDKNYNLLNCIQIDSDSLTMIRNIKPKIQVFYRTPYNNNAITSINIYFEDVKDFNNIKKILEKNLKNCFVEYKFPKMKIINQKCNKLSAIKIIQEVKNLNSKNIYTIGDDVNDVEMIKEYNGFSLITAKDEVKKYSKKNYENLSDLIMDIKINE